MVWILIGYVFLFVHRPFEVWPVLANFRLERVYMLFALGAWIATYNPQRAVVSSLHRCLAAFVIVVLLSFCLSPWNGLAGPQTCVENYLKVTVFYVLVVTTINNERDLRRLVLAFLLVMALTMIHSLREYLAGRHVYRMGIARMVGISSYDGDPNSFAASIAYALPLVLPAWSITRTRGMYALLVGYVALSVVCIVLTGSRTGFLLLLALTTVLLLLRSRRKLLIIGLSAMLLPTAWGLIPDELQNRFETIIHPEVGPANAQASAEARTEGWKNGLSLWQRYSILGCGPGAWIPATGSRNESHQLYGQILGELGTFGALAFGALLFGFYANTREIARAYRLRSDRSRDFLYCMAQAIGLSVVLMLMGGLGGHNLFRYTWVWYAAFLAVAGHCCRMRAAATRACHGYNVTPGVVTC
jgi:hypothetical protein